MLWEQEKLLIMSNFSVFPDLSTLKENCQPYLLRYKKCLQALSIWKSLKFVVWERVKDYTRIIQQASCITNRQACTNHNSVMLNGLLYGMFVFHKFLFIKQTYPVSILERAIAGVTQILSEIKHFFFQTNERHSRIEIDENLLFEGKRLSSLKSDKSLFTKLSFFLNRIHVHCCQLKPTYSLKELLPFINTID